MARPSRVSFLPQFCAMNRETPSAIWGSRAIYTEQKQAEAALRESQQYARSLIESSLDMIIAVDLDRKILEFNTAAQSAFGYSLEGRCMETLWICYTPIPRKRWRFIILR